MKTYTFKIPYEGYSRGKAKIKIEANSKEEAIKNIKDSWVECLEPDRDDTDMDYDEFEEINEN